MGLSKIRIARISLGLTQTSLANLTYGQITQRRLSDLERGMPVKLEEAKALSGILGLPPQELGVTLSEAAAT